MDQPALGEEDERFVDLLYSAFSSAAYEHLMEAATQNRPFKVAFAEWVEHGLWDENDVAGAEAFYREHRSGQAALRGRFAGAIRELGLRLAGPDRSRLEHIPLLLMPTGNVNARVFAGPSGLPIVVLNHGVASQMGLVISAILSFITWHDDEPFCADVEQGDYAAAIVGLAAAVISNDLRPLYPHRDTLRFESLGDFNKEADFWLQLAEGFIVLHEFGHILGGHLTDPVNPQPRKDALASEYSRTQLDEFEADKYAIQRIAEGGRDDLRLSDVALVAGLVLRFFVLCERLAGARVGPASHPPASDRWLRVKELTRLDDHPDALAHRLDGGFAVIEARLFEADQGK